MSEDINFGGGMLDLGRFAAKELLKNDYGPGERFNDIHGHNPQNHHGGLHEQVSLFTSGVSGSDLTMRFFDK